MSWLLIALLTGLPVQAPEPELPTLTFDGKAFVEAFNAASDRGRLVVVIAPTCGHCLQLASQVNEILQGMPDAKVQVLVLWAPYMRTDNRATAIRSTRYLSDPRVQHFWDLWRFGSRVYTEQLGIPPLEAWDMVVYYEPGIRWGEKPPEPTFWMQNRQLDVGRPYSKEDLARELRNRIGTNTGAR